MQHKQSMRNNMTYHEALRQIDRNCPIPSARLRARQALLLRTKEEMEWASLDLMTVLAPWRSRLAYQIRNALKNMEGIR